MRNNAIPTTAGSTRASTRSSRPSPGDASPTASAARRGAWRHPGPLLYCPSPSSFPWRPVGVDFDPGARGRTVRGAPVRSPRALSATPALIILLLGRRLRSVWPSRSSSSPSRASRPTCRATPRGRTRWRSTGRAASTRTPALPTTRRATCTPLADRLTSRRWRPPGLPIEVRRGRHQARRRSCSISRSGSCSTCWSRAGRGRAAAAGRACWRSPRPRCTSSTRSPGTTRRCGARPTRPARWSSCSASRR